MFDGNMQIQWVSVMGFVRDVSFGNFLAVGAGRKARSPGCHWREWDHDLQLNKFPQGERVHG